MVTVIENQSLGIPKENPIAAPSPQASMAGEDADHFRYWLSVNESDLSKLICKLVGFV